MTYTLPTIKNLETFRQQLNAILANIFGTANAFTAVQTFPAGGIIIGTVKVLSGSGVPEGVVLATVGSMFLRTDGSTSTTLYIKTSGGAGNTGWTAK